MCEDYILYNPPAKLSKILGDVLSTRNYFKMELEQTSGTTDAAESRRIDQTADDDNKSYDAKMGKWASMAWKAVQDPAFWVCMAISNRMSDVLDPFLARIM